MSKKAKSQTKEDVSNSVVGIKEAGLMVQNTALIEENKKLAEQLLIAEEKIKRLQESSSSSDLIKIIPSDAEIIADIQIRMIKEYGMARALTLDETRQLEILYKIKRLANEQPSDIEGKAKKLPSNAEDLMKIAKKGIS